MISNEEKIHRKYLLLREWVFVEDPHRVERECVSLLDLWYFDNAIQSLVV